MKNTLIAITALTCIVMYLVATAGPSREELEQQRQNIKPMPSTNTELESQSTEESKHKLINRPKFTLRTGTNFKTDTELVNELNNFPNTNLAQNKIEQPVQKDSQNNNFAQVNTTTTTPLQNNRRQMTGLSDTSHFNPMEYKDLLKFFKEIYGDEDIFTVLGAYQDYFDQDNFDGYPMTSRSTAILHWIKSDKQYCKRTDSYLLENPDVVFNKMNVITNFKDSTVTTISKQMDLVDYTFVKKPLPTDLHMLFSWQLFIADYEQLGKSFGCASQVYNHIPGNLVLRKDMIPALVGSYALRYANKPSQCFDKSKFSPPTFRLYKKNECQEFFSIIAKPEFQEKLKKNEFQYIVKIGAGSARGEGVYLLDEEELDNIRSEFGKNGESCGKKNLNRLAQTYISNPLLLQLHNKFDFRVYFLLSSVDPLIGYYRDGFLRITLRAYNANSNDKEQYLTNTAVSDNLIEELRKKNETLNGMTADELDKAHKWDYQQLNDYLNQIGKVNDPNWLENYLRPIFKKAMIHLAKMAEPNFIKTSNSFEFYGLDFMIDDDLNVWYIECNTGPGHFDQPFYHKLIGDVFKLQFAYYRSRMFRIFEVLKKMKVQYEETGFIELGHFRREYARATKNRLEPQFESILADNSFVKIMDENLKGKDRYSGLIDEECILED